MTRWDRFAASAALVALWMSWPVLEVVGNGPIFFLARGAFPTDTLAVGIVLAVVVPFTAGAASALLPGVAARAAFKLANVVSSLALSGQLVRAIGSTSVVVWIGLAFVLAAVFEALFDRSGTFRQLIRYLIASPLVILGVFLFATPAGAVLFADEPPAVAAAQAVRPTPVVLVVFDELPTASLMTPSGAINSDWYPGFARLQADSTWFRNAATVHQQTDQAVPAILTGRVPDVDDLPIRSHHPQSIFTLLGPEYTILSQELVTDLCPPGRCSQPLPDAATAERWGVLTEDLLLLSAHTFFPDAITRDLPRIDQQWANFAKIAQRDASRSPRQEVEAYIDALREVGGGPAFFFLHAMLPHRPWVYLPDGTFYGGGASPTSVGVGVDTAWQTAQSLQRHLLQTQYTDQLLARLIASLEESDLYADALVIVTADHGASFTDQGADRIVTGGHVDDIGSVPLFVKFPRGQGAGVVDDYRALTTDILPTIADVVGLELVGQIDGTSLASADRPERDTSITFGPEGPVEWSADGAGKYRTAARIADAFPDGDLFALRLQSAPELHGLGPEQLDGFVRAEGWTLSEPGRFSRVGDANELSPAFVEGRTAEASPDQLVVVAVNGIVRGVTRSRLLPSEERAFEVLVDPRHFLPGGNSVDIYVAPWETITSSG